MRVERVGLFVSGFQHFRDIFQISNYRASNSINYMKYTLVAAGVDIIAIRDKRKIPGIDVAAIKCKILLLMCLINLRSNSPHSSGQLVDYPLSPDCALLLEGSLGLDLISQIFLTFNDPILTQKTEFNL